MATPLFILSGLINEIWGDIMSDLPHIPRWMSTQYPDNVRIPSLPRTLNSAVRMRSRRPIMSILTWDAPNRCGIVKERMFRKYPWKRRFFDHVCLQSRYRESRSQDPSGDSGKNSPFSAIHRIGDSLFDSGPEQITDAILSALK